MSAQSKALVASLSPYKTVGSNPVGLQGCVSLVSVVFYQVEVSVWG
jgi:hypothetical protein